VRRLLTWSLSIILLSAVALSVLWRFMLPAEPPAVSVEGIRVEVFNGCGVPRLARAVGDRLLTRGFDVYTTGNETERYDRTTVVDLMDPAGGNARRVADALAARRRFWFIPLRDMVRPETRVACDSSRYLEVRIIVGADHASFFPGARPLH